MRNLRVYEEAWPLHTLFVIARGSRSEAKVVVVEVEENGVKGVGECTPYPRYGESIASVMAQILTIGEQLESGATREQLQHLLPAGRRVTPSTAHCGICRRVAWAKAFRSCWGCVAEPGGDGADGGDRHPGADGGQCRGAVGKGRAPAEGQA